MMNPTRFLFVAIASLAALAGCAKEVEETDATEGAATAADGPFKCTLTVKESIPVKKVSFRMVPGGATGCSEGGIPASQITETVDFNAAPAGAEVLCASHGQGSGDGTGTGVAFFHFTRTVATTEFTMTAECAPGSPSACFAKMAGKDVVGPFLMLDGNSADKTERMGLVHGSLVPRLDLPAGTFEISLLGTHTFFDPASGDGRGADGQATALSQISAPVIKLSTSFEVKRIDTFGLDDRVELSCTR
jgi:hypothetical protein